MILIQNNMSANKIRKIIGIKGIFSKKEFDSSYKDDVLHIVKQSSIHIYEYI